MVLRAYSRFHALTACDEQERAMSKLHELDAQFRLKAYKLSRDLEWKGQVGAVDGMDIPQANPGTAVKDPMRYYVPRKRAFCLLLMAIADAKYRILFWDMSCAPHTHDSTAFAHTTLGARLESSLPQPFFLSGDAAFRPGHPGLVTPATSRNDDWDNYNYVQSSPRMPVSTFTCTAQSCLEPANEHHPLMFVRTPPRHDYIHVRLNKHLEFFTHGT